MFMQIIQGHVIDADRFQAEAERWGTDLKPGATGYLGCTWGVADDGTAVLAARFDTEASATANSKRPEQGQWWSAIEPTFKEVAFHDCTEVDTMLGGGSDEAGFVQVIQGRVKDQAAARAMFQEVEGQLAEGRPDILGGLMAWHGHDGDFTQLMYFRSEDAARSGEASAADTELGERYQDMMATEPQFIDLPRPQFD